MTNLFTYAAGDAPLLISVPHDGREIPITIKARMTQAGLDIPDTDWHVAELYAFARELGAHILVANFSRYVVDLNRSANDDVLYPGRLVTGLCPQTTFSGDDIYAQKPPNATEEQQRIIRYWQPYHEKIRTSLTAIRERFGYALLWDAHSIPSTVPRLFDGELPLLNLGSNDGASCSAELERSVVVAMQEQCKNCVSNGRFKGGYITREYGDPAHNVHALQLEIAQRAYMDERNLSFDTDRAAILRRQLRTMIGTFLASAHDLHEIQ